MASSVGKCQASDLIVIGFVPSASIAASFVSVVEVDTILSCGSCPSLPSSTLTEVTPSSLLTGRLRMLRTSRANDASDFALIGMQGLVFCMKHGQQTDQEKHEQGRFGFHKMEVGHRL